MGRWLIIVRQNLNNLCVRCEEFAVVSQETLAMS